ncbi:cellulose synthase-like protein H1 [Diospyros lotus]|uniref:cellulose synthase-like protein H1 n=1 Tax=Diospyros lotus TaxID=55363 RepID=UPI00224CDEDA|nr:cellulose synthase-like protein H1 [Diospyros lotus]XP_052178159.1 cellulose synthase-like protein H1 [Diospyros lotus]XP_052178160.1 cellulose synthase-like protein H1 [Diospyros lotus]XP_052178161.1 cellulose synthase-like protein H1 [Diospyros lotus]XP_052178162.1 cellulose synthase-like protein H1 [Diospyros lotus]XP_052178163.1 cellulose synthase-like protein H1 [Diospyros lotus]XP_052178164.1 cellulose synthase-like protein H1 [Diospyros lotus]
MASPASSLPLYQRFTRRNYISRTIEVAILFLLLYLLLHRLLSPRIHGFAWLLAFLCESWFTFTWVLVVSTKWKQVEFKTYPQRLLQRKVELPPVDMFVTTADPVLEPPILTVNTVLSLLAVDYPPDKLACYVSDDGGSPLTLYSLVEASKFARLWVPFCKKHGIQLRAPFRYFSSQSSSSQDASPEFRKERKKIQYEYEHLCQIIEDASRRPLPCELVGDFKDFSNIQRGNHPSIVKVIWENKDHPSKDGSMPHLIYISREKRPHHSHNFKAGAMNVLTRVSGVMTNAPIMLNLDCDMHVNNPQIILHAMCFFMDIKNERDCGYVQSPQSFYDGLKDDPFGNRMEVLFKYLGYGIVGIQGPFYQGTNCFHRRKVIYGLSPDDEQINGKLRNIEASKSVYGSSIEFTALAAETLSGLMIGGSSEGDLSSCMDAAHIVAGCGYEYGTKWGSEVGWMYGSTTEDMHTGLSIQGRGWRSTYCTPDPPAFLGCAPSGGPAAMIQHKRWATGLLEVLLGPKSPPILMLKRRLQFRQGLAYLYVLLWAIRSIPELCYAALPAYCIIADTYFLPKKGQPGFLTTIFIFLIYNFYTLSEYLRAGLSIRAWWNNQRMWKITAMNAWFFGALSVGLKLLGISDTVFEVTQKDQPAAGDNTDANAGRFTFNDSPIFIPGTTILLINLAALAAGLLGFRLTPGEDGFGIGEVVCSVYVVLCSWAFLKGLFGRGKYGIPLPTIFKSGALAMLFVQLSKWF